MKGKSLLLIAFGFLLVISGTTSIIFNNTKKNTNSTSSGPLFDGKKNQEDFITYVSNKFSKNYFNVSKTASVNNLEYLDLSVEYDLLGEEGVFYLNTLWVKSYQDNIVKLASDYEILNYQSYLGANENPIFKILGIGGEPTNPKLLFIIPADRIKKTHQYIQKINEFKKNELHSNFFYDINDKTLR
jgi:hypothetical protein